MRIGIGLALPGSSPTLDGLVAEAQQAERSGFATVWMANVFGLDALTTLAIVGRETERIGLGTYVVPTYPRHPVALAQQALTTSAAAAGRFTLGIGRSHKIVIENMFGLDYSRPLLHTREYLTVLNGLLAGEQVRFAGELYRVNAQYRVPGVAKPPVVVAALGPAMLRLCGRLADGTATWMGGLPYLRDVAIPTISAAAAEAGRPAPRVIAGLPVCVTDDPAAAREAAAKQFETYGRLPSYRATLDRGGAAGPADVAVVGTESEVAARLHEFAAAGVTEFMAAPFAAPGGGIERTSEALVALARAS